MHSFNGLIIEDGVVAKDGCSNPVPQQTLLGPQHYIALRSLKPEEIQVVKPHPIGNIGNHGKTDM